LVGASGDYVYGTAKSYGEHVFYNRRINKKYYFSGTNLSAYSMKCCDSKVYIAGYPNFELVEYDLQSMTRKDLGHFQDQVQTHRPFAGIEQGNDGKIYICGRYYRTRDGGGLAWYDPVNGNKGGLKIDYYDPYWMTTINSGAQVVMSCKEENGILLIYDIASAELTVSKIDGLYPAIITGVGDSVIGYGISDSAGAIIYKLDPVTKEIFWQRKVPENPDTALNLVRTHSYIKFYDGNDHAYFNVGDYLVKIDVNTGEPKVLGKLPLRKQIHITENGEILQAGHAEGFVKLTLP
jgi:hypothetical protein